MPNNQMVPDPDRAEQLPLLPKKANEKHDLAIPRWADYAAVPLMSEQEALEQVGDAELERTGSEPGSGTGG